MAGILLTDLAPAQTNTSPSAVPGQASDIFGIGGNLTGGGLP